MTDIQFDEDHEFMHTIAGEKKPFFLRLVLATGIVSNDRQAEYVLLGVSVFLIIIAFAIPSFVGSPQSSVPQSTIDAAMKVPSHIPR
ncbi:MAG: hypothetical protein WCW36_02495 [Candidatus Paceibacterota bacterium]|jgi:hypothetical protein